MPPPCSRRRSRRARSSGGRFSSSAPRARGSARISVVPRSVSWTHRHVAGSDPSRERRKVTRSPSGEIWKPRGTPMVKCWVRACWRGKLIRRLCRTQGRAGSRAGAECRAVPSGPERTGSNGIVPCVMDRRLMMVHAHPDDESIVTGATLAKYAADGAQVTLVTCTLGEEGEIIPANLAHLASDRDDTLGEHRIEELSRACRALNVRDQRFLGGAGHYRDSGMMDGPTNDHPKACWGADVAEAGLRLAELSRGRGPQGGGSYGEHG